MIKLLGLTILGRDENYIAAINQPGGVAVRTHCYPLELIRLFAAVTAAVRIELEKHGHQDLLETLPEIVRNVLDDQENIPDKVRGEFPQGTVPCGDSPRRAGEP